MDHAQHLIDSADPTIIPHSMFLWTQDRQEISKPKKILKDFTLNFFKIFNIT